MSSHRSQALFLIPSGQVPQLTGSPNNARQQSAYRLGHVTDTVYRTAGIEQATILVGLDISAAFHTISHDVSMNRLNVVFGATGAAVAWLRLYLTGRHQCIKVGRHQSEATARTSGVSLLFAAYVSPVGQLIESLGVACHQFAVDNTVVHRPERSQHGPPSGPTHLLHVCHSPVVFEERHPAKRWQVRSHDNGHCVPTAQDRCYGVRHYTAGCWLPVSTKLKSLDVVFDSHLQFDANASAV
jgi:hypothetical protein